MTRLITLLVAFAIIAPGVGCKKPIPSGPEIIGMVYDCAREAGREDINTLITQLAPLVLLQAPDWDAVYEAGVAAGATTGGCAIAEIVQAFLSNRSSPPTPTDGHKARDTLEKFRHEHANDGVFETVIDGRRVRL